MHTVTILFPNHVRTTVKCAVDPSTSAGWKMIIILKWNLFTSYHITVWRNWVDFVHNFIWYSWRFYQEALIFPLHCYHHSTECMMRLMWTMIITHVSTAYKIYSAGKVARSVLIWTACFILWYKFQTTDSSFSICMATACSVCVGFQPSLYHTAWRKWWAMQVHTR